MAGPWQLAVASLALAVAGAGATPSEDVRNFLTAPERLLPPFGMKALMEEAKHIMPELFWDAPQAIQAQGYPVETHRVTTSDGYVLTMHRIPRGRRAVGGQRRGPVLLQHGLFGASDSWVIGGRGIAPAYYMADEGYDVWIGNSRGNFYSREHINMTVKNPAFWRFSWHEMGMYDIPALIDYVLKVTAQDKIIYVGHSMGNNELYVLLSSKPEYIQKIKLQVGIAPSVFWNNLKAPIAKFIRDNQILIKNVMDQQNTYELLRPSPERSAFYFYGCHKNSAQKKLCQIIFYAAVGVSGIKNPSKLPVHLARMMESTSGTTLLHLAQNAKSGRFCQFDYGVQINLHHYGKTQPPAYNLKNITLPVALYSSKGDDLVPFDGVTHLAQELPHVLEVYKVPLQVFNHLDFLVHENLYNLLVRHILNIMAKY